MSYIDLFRASKTPATQARQTTTSPYARQSPYQSQPGLQAPAAYTPPPSPYYTANTATRQQAVSPKLQQQINLQRQRMGAAGNIFSPDQLVRRQDVGWGTVNLELENMQKQELDRQQAYEELMRSWYGLGQSPEALEAKRMAMTRAQSGGPWTQGLLEQGRGTIRNVGSVGLQGAQRNMAEELARRGMGGSSIAGLDQARLAQQSQLGIQQQLAEFEQNAALQNEAAQQAALQQLTQLAETEQAQRLGIDEAIAQLYAGTQREPLSLAPVIETPKRPKKAV